MPRCRMRLRSRQFPAAGSGGGGGGGGGNYRRPDLSSAALDLTNLTISKEQRELLVNRLTLLARNFTDSKLLNKEWRARVLALALRLDPNDRSCIVANGQWARGVVPQPVDSPLKLDAVAVDLLKVATEILKTSPAPASPEHALCLHLLDLATRLDVTNRAVFELFSKDSPQLRWDALVPAKPSRPSLQEEETPDLLLSKTSINLPLYRQQDGRKVVTVRPFAATAQKLPPGQKRPLQVYLPPDSDRELENALPNLRTILKARNPQWPAGWRVDLGPLTASPSAQPGSILGVAVVLESLVTGTQLDPLAIPACGLDPAAASFPRQWKCRSF